MIYAVLAHRGGDRENHTYLVCVTESPVAANLSAKAHEEYRGGKYSCSIHELEIATWVEETDDTAIKEIVPPYPIEGWKTAAERYIEEAKREKAWNEVLEPLFKKVVEVVDEWNSDPILLHAPKHPFTNMVEKARKALEEIK